MKKQAFGGNWTEEKLNRLRKYLVAYSTIMRNYNFKYAYIDAFAGTGYRNLREDSDSSVLLLPEFLEPDSQTFISGSARIALQTQPRFDKYIFVEKDTSKVVELSKLKSEFSSLAGDIEIVNSDASIYLKQLCSKTWKSHRAVLFLDPFGMQISWDTIVDIAKTEAIDLWYLFPLGIAVNRLLTKDGNIQPSVQKRLNETFGTTDWYNSFYQLRRDINLFGEYSLVEKSVDIKAIGEYFVSRLKTIFAGVAENPLLLLNSRNSPLYLLCFASANRKGAKTAIKIAQDILKKSK